MRNIQTLARQNIRELKPYSSARDEFSGTDGIFLDANENPFGDLNRYPDPQQRKLKQRLSELKRIPTENIFLGNGSDEIIDLCFRVFCEPRKDRALTFTPTYGMYEVSAGINAIELIKVPLNSEFQIDKILSYSSFKIENLKLVFICSPNNPTGNAICNIEFILENFDGIVIVDEAYADFNNGVSMVNMIDKYPNLIVFQTLSKAWGMASLRIGMAFAGTEIISLLNKVKPPYNISGLNQEKALSLLDDEDGFNRRRLNIVEQKKQLIQELSTIGFVKKIFPSDTNFLLVQVSDANFLYGQLIRNGIVVRNRSHEVENCLRITIGSGAENDFLIKILKQIKL